MAKIYLMKFLTKRLFAAHHKRFCTCELYRVILARHRASSLLSQYHGALAREAPQFINLSPRTVPTWIQWTTRSGWDGMGERHWTLLIMKLCLTAVWSGLQQLVIEEQWPGRLRSSVTATLRTHALIFLTLSVSYFC